MLCRGLNAKRPAIGISLLWLVCAMTHPGVAPAQVTETILHNFFPPPMGANAYSGVIRDSAGNLYGTTGYGGAENAGAVYKLSPKGRLSVLYSFTGRTDGSGPRSGVIRDSGGDLYGTTAYGGTWGAGVIYEINAAGQFSVLYSFTGGSDGAYPFAGVVEDSAGNLYGATAYGGSANTHQGNGVVYMLNPSGQLTVLHTFTGGSDGSYAWAGVTRDASGNLYGTTYLGGTPGQGIIYKLDTSNNETVLYSFTGGADGANPQANVILDPAGNIYGTTFNGGAAGEGVVFELTTAGQETPLHSFAGGTDGANPYAGVVRDSSGNLYGTTIYGGAARAGVVYKLTAAGKETLYSFTGGADGAYPYAGVIRASGNLYGAAAYGGAAGLGDIFELEPGGTQTVLYGFPQSAGGYSPNSGLTIDSGGALFGTTPDGGAYGFGAVYKMSAAGRQTVLYSFTGSADGSGPNAGVVRDSAGNLYGTTFTGGASGQGVVYKVAKSGAETVLYNFSGGADGANPYGGVILDSSGNLYGTAWYGGTGDAGVIYEVSAGGVETVLYNFTGAQDSTRSYSSLARDSAGDLYGVGYAGGTDGFGSVYEVAANGQFTTLYNFTGGTDGRYPYAGVTLDSSGNLYGTTEAGGSAYAGVIYKVSAGGQFTVLYSFTGGAGGDYPDGGVTLDTSGNLYGTTTYGGASGTGLVYQLNTANQLTVLYNFAGMPDGANPQAGVIFDSSGNLYGTAQFGGTGNVGAVFKLTGVQ